MSNTGADLLPTSPPYIRGAQQKNFECVWQYGHHIHESQIVTGDVICWVSGQDDQNETQNALPFWNLL
jgi:hypothetical protein